MSNAVWVTAIESYEPGEMEILVVSQGERLSYKRKDTDWAGWIWCTAVSGRAAWVPEAWVDLVGESCVVMRDYNSKELSVSAGEILELLLEESGWMWVCNSEGDRGWIPADRIGSDLKGSI